MGERRLTLVSPSSCCYGGNCKQPVSPDSKSSSNPSAVSQQPPNMQLLAVLSLVSAVAATCAGNNCNRAVTGTRPGLLPLTSRSSDCASYLRTTVTPKATYASLPPPLPPPQPQAKGC